MADKLEKDEKARIAAQVERLGSEGLKKAEVELEVAKTENEKAVPTELITSFPVPDVKTISWLPVQSFQEPDIDRNPVQCAPAGSPLSKYIDSDGKSLHFFVGYDHVEVCSNCPIFLQQELIFCFLFISRILCQYTRFSRWLNCQTACDRKSSLRPHLVSQLWISRYISAYLSSFFSLPVQRASGVLLSHEEVVNQLDNETVSYEAELGVSYCFTDIFRVSIKVEIAHYETAIAWLKDLVYGAEFDKDRYISDKKLSIL